MFREQKRVLFVFLVAIALFVANSAFAGNTTIAYPDAKKPEFTVTAPDDWEMTPGEEEGDYFTLEGPSGAVLSLRAIPGTKEDLEAAIQDAVDYLKESYKDVKMGEATQMEGVDGFVAGGTGKDKEDGSALVFGFEWFALKDGHIAEVWFEAAADDKEGADAAKAILATFKGM